MHRRIGIILNRRNVGTFDRRITLLAADGKHDLRARGTQKISSKLAGSLEPLTLVDMTTVPGRSGEHITGSSIRDAYRTIHANVARVAGAAVIAGAADNLVHGRLDDSAVLKIVREALALVGRSRTNRDVLLGTAYGLWNILTALGYGRAAKELRTSQPVRRLVAVLAARNPNVVRRVACSMSTARTAVELALSDVERASDREVAAAAFFRSVTVVRRRSPAARRV